METVSIIQLFVFVAILLILTVALGRYMAKLFSGERSILHPVLGWLEKLCYSVTGVNHLEETTWITYAKSLLFFNLFGFLAVFLLQLAQGYLPLNPQGLSGTSLPLAFNTAVSFATNTNWQAYSGEVTLSYLTQMLGLTVQNFLSAASGMGVLLVLIRGISRKNMTTIGNFWSDLVRSTVYLFLPLSIILALLLVGEGVVQTLSSYVEVTTLENAKQTIPLGPVASQVAIKQLGTNGGGFFGANSAHPFENPTAFSNFLETLAILLIPAASVYTFGLMTGHKKHAFMLLFVMFLLWGFGLAVSLYSESIHKPILDVYPVLEGKETRFGIYDSIFWTVTTTATSNGSVNAMISSLSPIAGGIAMLNIKLGELIFGGVGVGLCSMIMFTILTVFLAGLMVGRTPEYFGKKIGKREMQWVIAAVVIPGALILIGSGISAVLPMALSSLSNKGPHGLSEVLYAFSSAAGNNGSAFAGLNANTDYYNIVLGFIMLIGRLAILIPSLAIAGLLVRKKITPPSAGTFSTNTFLFIFLLLSVILIVGALTFFPALSLGPVVEHLLMLEQKTF